MSPLLNAIVTRFPASSMVTPCPVTFDLYGYSCFVFDESKFQALWTKYINGLSFSQQCNMMQYRNEACDIARDKVDNYLYS